MTLVLVPLLASLGPAALLLLVAVVFVETGLLLGFFLPGDSLLFAAGLFVATGVMPLPLPLVIAATFTAAVLGDQLAFAIGRRGGRSLLRSRRPWTRRVEHHLAAAARFFDRHGPYAVVLARFVPLARTFTPVVAGATAMRRRTFTAYNALGGLLWTGGLLAAGFLLGGVPLVAHHVELVTVGLVSLSLVPALVAALRRRRRVSDAAATPRTEPRPDRPHAGLPG